MKSVKIPLIFCGLIFGFLISVSCQSNLHELDSKIIMENKQDSIFKRWVGDTMEVIKKMPDKIGDGLIDVRFVIAGDSLSLDEVKTYGYKSYNKVPNRMILNVIALLKEYDELPPNDYELSFITSTYFFSSAVPTFPYGYLFEFKDVTVVYDGRRINYGYIRGRLSNKTVSWNDTLANKSKVIYDFIWKDHKLIKIKR